MGRFDGIKVGDQLERKWISEGRGRERPPEIAMVTHIWDDPVERKTFIGLALVRRDGTVGEPTMKHTRRGLASNRWQPATRDWVAWAKAVKAENVVLLRNPLVSRWSARRDMTMVSLGHLVQNPDRCLVLFDKTVVGEIWREVSTWHWKLTEPEAGGTAATEREAAKALTKTYEAGREGAEATVGQGI